METKLKNREKIFRIENIICMENLFSKYKVNKWNFNLIIYIKC
jgi:hypothetical protein